MVDWDYLQNNMTNINLTNITDSLQDPTLITSTIIDNVDTTSQGYFGLIVMLVMFIVLVFKLYKDDGDLRIDIARTIMFSSGFVSIVGFISLTLNIFSSLTHVMWFFVVFLVSIVSVLILKKKGL